MCAREDCQALLASIDKMPLSVNEMAVAFENGGRSINLFPVALHHASASAWFARTRPGCSRLPLEAERLSPDLGRREVLMVTVRRTEMAELLKELVVSMPQRQAPQPAEPDAEREVIMAAAAHLDHHRREREELKQQLAAAQAELQKHMMEAQVLLQAKDVKIEEAELALATEQQRVAIYQDERDRAVGARCQAEADLRATEQLYGELLARLERFRLPAIEIKRKGNGNGNGKHRVDAASIVPDGVGATEAMLDEDRSAPAL